MSVSRCLNSFRLCRRSAEFVNSVTFCGSPALLDFRIGSSTFRNDSRDFATIRNETMANRLATPKLQRTRVSENYS